MSLAKTYKLILAHDDNTLKLYHNTTRKKSDQIVVDVTLGGFVDWLFIKCNTERLILLPLFNRYNFQEKRHLIVFNNIKKQSMKSCFGF
jgi:hypothetical protein